MWYSGIDQHKRDSVITTYGPDGPRVKQVRVANTPLALAQYFADFPAPHKAVVESTGGWYWLADVLAPLGVELVLAHATRLKAISAAKVKTDQVDSDVLALRGWKDTTTLLKCYTQPDAETVTAVVLHDRPGRAAGN
jgi:transposase